jgi:hypothetical protein
MDYDFDLVNRGTITEQLTVRIVPKGPCPFLPPSRKSYLLKPGQGFAVSALMIAPSCPGEYFLRADVRLGDRLLDRAIVSFTVRDQSATKSRT